MSFLIFAFACAFSQALMDLSSKRGLKSLDSLTVTWGYFLLTTILLCPMLAFEPVPDLEPKFFFLLFIQSTLFGISVILYMSAIKISALSIVMPLTMLTPVFMLATAPLILGQWPSPLGLVGVLFIVGGSYLLNIDALTTGIFGPFNALRNDKGARLMILTAFIWSFTSLTDKLGIKSSNLFFWGFSVYFVVTVFLTILLLIKKHLSLTSVIKNSKILVLIAIFNSIQVITYFFALDHGSATYVLAIKRTNILMLMIIGSIFFKEKNLKERFFAASLMFVGVLCISFSKT